jgi:cell division protein FtsQ
MARKPGNGSPAARSGLGKLAAFRSFLLPVLGGTLAMLVSLIIFQKAENFVTQNGRFVLRKGGIESSISQDLRITGLSRTPASEVRKVFRGDEGQSVFQIPLAARREELMRIQWVKTATVSRFWPNRVDVRVTERKPAAFIRLPARRRGGETIPALIDLDGVILPAPKEQGVFELPALAGVREDQPVAERALRVRRMEELLRDLGKTADQVGEIDAANLKNWKLTLQVGDRAVTLILGEEDFARKVERFLQHWPEIVKRAPQSYLFDLRLDDRITAIDPPEVSEEKRN